MTLAFVGVPIKKVTRPRRRNVPSTDKRGYRTCPVTRLIGSWGVLPGKIDCVRLDVEPVDRERIEHETQALDGFTVDWSFVRPFQSCIGGDLRARLSFGSREAVQRKYAGAHSGENPTRGQCERTREHESYRARR